MYTNIKTAPALNEIRQYFQCHKQKYSHIPLDALFKALNLITENNIISFCNGFWLQKKGTAMGAPPAPQYITVSFSIFKFLTLHKFQNNLLFFKQYFDNIILLWKHHNTLIDAQEFQAFKVLLNNWYGLK
eukprot:15334794-Ditylum_brightwellii.AAC.1